MSLPSPKVPPALVAAAAALLMWAFSALAPTVELALSSKATLSGLAVVTAAVFGLGGVISFIRAHTTVNPHRPERASTLVTSGIFRVTRNPMYLALALALTALAVWIGFPWSLIGVAAFVVYIDRFQIRPEERVLTARFGDEYRKYQARVRRWL